MRLEWSVSAQCSDQSIEDFGGFGGHRLELGVPGGAEKSEPVERALPLTILETGDTAARLIGHEVDAVIIVD